MATLVKIFCSLFIFIGLAHCGTTNDACVEPDLQIEELETGSEVGGKPQYYFNAKNTCDKTCNFTNVILGCPGFQTTEPVDPSILKIDGDNCVLNNGGPIVGGGQVEFKYAWDKIYGFQLKSANIACS
ncbi:unnamed protein product [Amaranthus hypochondriacus]